MCDNHVGELCNADMPFARSVHPDTTVMDSSISIVTLIRP